ncbi:MAG: hypothetical protein H6821_00885 [Planctomycetaceae bacterium]|nr:hypothetical protein [Planctomycetales bacterium]MCB9872705.1 hypothetical protein [Planctomycetaceae bacterium]MCB9926192.1 hypothetical protein [Planctomycetaceae bacterium]
MTEPFEPYREWLGIEPHEMPVDHYRLLGVRRFEDDPTVIAAAADHRMLHVRSHQTGRRAVYTQKLLNELAAAKVCLLNPGSKASYDQVLQAVFFTPDAPPPIGQIAIAPFTINSQDLEVVVDDSSEDFEEEFEEQSGSNLWFVSGVIAFVLLLVTVSTVAYRLRMAKQREMQADDWQSPQIGASTLDDLNYEESEPILLYQEANGSINLDASFAQLHGPSIGLAISGNVDVIDAWESMDDWVSWAFKVVKLPPQGVFQVRVTYAARVEADGGSFVIAIGDQEKVCDVRGTGEVVTDEYFIAVPSSGVHTLAVRAKSKPSQRLMTLKSVNLAFE